MKQIDVKVLVLLSAYNGEKYIGEQLDSLLALETSVDILIRDDGSSDNTVDIIKEYCGKYDNISLLQGNNLGFVESFNELISNSMVENYTWIAFCDQDDVWLPNKLSEALRIVSSDYDDSKPIMYCSNLIVTDERLNIIGRMHKSKPNLSLESVLVQNPATGCTVLFNKSAALLYRKSINNTILSHDYNMLMICTCMGKVYYDYNSYIFYRQHGDNIYGGISKKVSKGVIDILTDLFIPKVEMKILWLTDFVETYRDKIDDDSINILNTIIHYRKYIRFRFKLLFSKKYSGIDFKTTISFKIRALIGRIV